MYEFSPFGRDNIPRLMPKSGRTYDFRDEFTTSLAAASVNGTSCEPGSGTRTVIDTETCLSILPNVGSSLANQTGVTFGGSNNRCSYATGYGWMDFPTGFNAAEHANLGRIVVMYDSNGRAAWGYLGAGGSGESLGSENFNNPNFDNDSYWGIGSGWSISSGKANRIVDATTTNLYQSLTKTLGYLFKISADATYSSGDGYRNIICGIIVSTYRNSTGTHSDYLVCNSTNSQSYGFRANANFVGSIDNAYLKQVTSPSSTGCWIYPTLAAAVAGNTAASGWNKPSAFDMNSSTYTFNIYQPTSGGKLFFMGGKATAAAGDPGEWLTTAITRTAGQILAFKVNPTDATKILGVGASNAKTGTVVGNGLRIDTDLLKPLDSSTTGPGVFVPLDGVDYTLVCVLRAAGAQFFVKAGTGVFKRVWSYSTNNTSYLYVATTGNTLAGTIDFVRIPKTRWLPTPLLSDSFAATDATPNTTRQSDGLGHAEITGLGSGGIATWSGASGAIQSNRLVITPTLGSELLTNGTFEGTFTDGLASGWTKQTDVTAIEESTVVHGGSKAQAFTSSTVDRGIYVSVGLTINSWYRASAYVNSTSGILFMDTINSSNLYLGRSVFIQTISYTNISITGRSITGANSGFKIVTRNTDNTVYVDDSSFKQITLSSCFSTTTLITTDIEIQTSFQMTSGTQCGIVMGLNDAGTSFIIAYHDGAGNIKLEICESGTYTTKNSTAATYGSDYELKVARRTQSNGTSEIWVFYNSILIGAGPTTTLSAGESANLAGLKAGLFSTYGEADTFNPLDFDMTDFRNHYTGNSFDNTTVYAIGTNNEFSILDRLVGS